MQKFPGMTHDLGGGFVVRRLLPSRGKRMVGPFIFLDHFGPVEIAPTQNIDVRPHPHIGLSTLTYLYAGRMVHRDSLGFEQAIEPGDPSFDIKAVRLARIRMALEIAETYLLSVAAEVDAARAAGVSLRGAATQIHLNTLKVVASETSYEVANQLIELCGFERGYTRGGARLEQLLRDLRSAAINYSNDRLLSATGRLALLDPASLSSGSAVGHLTASGEDGEDGEPRA